MSTRNILVGLVNFVVGIIEILLSARLLLRLLGANPGTPFVQWVYDTSETFLAPFAGIFPTPAIEEGAVFEFSTLFAIIAYAIIAWLITALIDFLFDATTRDGRETRTVREVEVRE